MNNNISEVKVPVRLELLQESVEQMRKVLSNLKPDSNAWKEISNIIRGMEKEARNLEIAFSKPFGSQSQFNSVEKIIGKIDDGLERAKITMSSIKFSDIKLDTNQQKALQELQNELNSIKNEVTNFKAQIKEDLKLSDIWSDIEQVDPSAITHSFDEIVKTVESRVRSLKLSMDKAKEDLASFGDTEVRAATTKKFFTSKNGPLSVDSLGQEVYDQFFKTNGTFKSGKQDAFFQWIEQNLILDESQLAQLKDKTSTQLKQVFADFDVNKILKNVNAKQERVGAARTKADTTTANYEVAANVLKTLGAELEAVAQKEDSLEGRTNAANSALDHMKQTLTDNASAAGQAALATNTLSEATNELRNTLAKSNAEWLKQQRAVQGFNSIKTAVVNFMGFSQVLNLTKRAIREAVNHIKELDSVMNKIAIVTDMSTGDLWDQIENYSKMAQTYGTSIQGTYEVAQLYYQQGLKTNDVMILTNETLKLAKVSGLDYATTTDYMTSALRGFKMEMSEASTVVDVYSNLAANTAVTQEELAVAMSKTASSLQSVGSSFEESSAMISTMVAVTRESATNIGSALKSIAARYGEMKQDPLKLVDAEGDELVFNKVDAALQSVGISMKTTDGQFRDFTDVILELGEKWDQLESTQQRYIATQFAGNRQQSRFLALVSNIDLLKSNLDVALNSEDTGTLQALKALDSIESKIEQVRVAYQQFYTSIGAEDVFKGALDSIRKYVDYLNGLPKLFGKIPIGAITVLANGIGLLKMGLIHAIGDLADIWNQKIKEAQNNVPDLGKSVIDKLLAKREEARQAGESIVEAAQQGMKQKVDTAEAAKKVAEPVAKKITATEAQEQKEETPEKQARRMVPVRTPQENLRREMTEKEYNQAQGIIESYINTSAIREKTPDEVYKPSETVPPLDISKQKLSAPIEISNLQEALNLYKEILTTRQQLTSLDADTSEYADAKEWMSMLYEETGIDNTFFNGEIQNIIDNLYSEISKSFAESLQNVNPSAKASVDEINNIDPTFIGKMINGLSDIDLNADDAAAKVSELLETLKASAGEKAQGILSTFNNMGAEVGNSLSMGLLGSTGQVVSATTNLGQSIITALRTALNMHSPSPTIIAMFQNGVGDAIALGLEASAQNVTDAAGKLGLTISDELKAALETQDKINLSDYFEAGDARALLRQTIQKVQSGLVKEYQRVNDAHTKSMLDNEPTYKQMAFEQQLDNIETRREDLRNLNARINNIQYERIPVDYVVGTHNLDSSNVERMAKSWGGNIPSPSIAVRAMQDRVWDDFGNRDGSGIMTLFMPRQYVDPSMGETNLYPGDAYTPMLRHGKDYSTMESARADLDSQPEIGFDFRRDLGEAIRDATHIPDLPYLRKILQNSADLPFKYFSDDEGSAGEYRDTLSRRSSYIYRNDVHMHDAFLEYMKASGFNNVAWNQKENGASTTAGAAFTQGLYEAVDMMRKLEAFDSSPVTDDDRAWILRDKLYENLLVEGGIDVPSKFQDAASNSLVEQALQYIGELEQYPGYDWSESKPIGNVKFNELAASLGPMGMPLQGLNQIFAAGMDPRTMFFYDRVHPNGPMGFNAMSRYITGNVPGVAFNESGPLVQGEVGDVLNLDELREKLSSENLNLPPMKIDAMLDLTQSVLDSDIGTVITNTLKGGLANVDFSSESAVNQVGEMMRQTTVALHQLVPELKDAGIYAAEQVVAGMTIGLSSSVAEATNAATQLGQQVIAALNSGAGVSSPSVFAMQSGRFVMLGLEEGLTEAESDTLIAAQKAGQLVISTIDAELAKTPQGIKALAENFHQQIDAMGPEVSDSIKKSMHEAVDNSVNLESLEGIEQLSFSELAKETEDWRHSKPYVDMLTRRQKIEDIPKIIQNLPQILSDDFIATSARTEGYWTQETVRKKQLQRATAMTDEQFKDDKEYQQAKKAFYKTKRQERKMAAYSKQLEKNKKAIEEEEGTPEEHGEKARQASLLETTERNNKVKAKKASLEAELAQLQKEEQEMELKIDPVKISEEDKEAIRVREESEKAWEEHQTPDPFSDKVIVGRDDEGKPILGSSVSPEEIDKLLESDRKQQGESESTTQPIKEEVDTSEIKEATEEVEEPVTQEVTQEVDTSQVDQATKDAEQPVTQPVEQQVVTTDEDSGEKDNSANDKTETDTSDASSTDSNLPKKDDKSSNEKVEETPKESSKAEEQKDLSEAAAEANEKLEEQKDLLPELGDSGKEGGEGIKNAMEDASDAVEQTGTNIEKSSKKFNTWGSAIGMLASTVAGFFDQTTAGGAAAASALTVVGGALRAISSTGIMGILTGITTAVTGVIAFIDSLSLEKQIERATKQAEKLGNKAKEAKANYNSLDTGLKKVEELREKRNESVEATEEYQAAVDELAGKFPQLIAGFDESGNIILDTTNAVDILSDAYQKNKQAALDAAEAEYEKAKLEEKKKSEDTGNKVGEVRSDIGELLHQAITDNDQVAIDFEDASVQLKKALFNENQDWTSEASYNLIRNFKDSYTNFKSKYGENTTVPWEEVQEDYEAVLKMLPDVKSSSQVTAGYRKQVLSGQWQQLYGSNLEYLTKNNAASALVNNSIYNAFKEYEEATGQTYELNDYNYKFITANRENGQDYIHSMETFLSNLNKTKRELFEEMFSDSSNYSTEDFSEAFGDTLGFANVIPMLVEYYTTGIESIQRRLNAQLAKSLGKEADNTGKYEKVEYEGDSKFYSDFNKLIQSDTITETEESILNTILEQYDLLSKNGYSTQAESLGNQALSLFTQISGAPYEIETAMWSLILEKGITTYEGIQSIIDIISNDKETGNNKFIQPLIDLQNQLQENLTLSLETTINNFSENWSDLNKTISKLSSGLEFNEATDLINSVAGKKAGLALESFVTNNGKLVLSDTEIDNYLQATLDTETEKITYYTDTISGIIDLYNGYIKKGWHGELNEQGVTQLESIMGGIGSMKQYMTIDDGTETGKVVDYIVDWDKFITDFQERQKTLGEQVSNSSAIINWANQMLLNKKWDRGDYSSLDNIFDAGYAKDNLLTLSMVENRKKLSQYNDIPDVKNAVDKIQGAYGQLVSDAISYGLDNINLNDYKGLINKQEIETALKNCNLQEFISRYAQYAGKTIDEINDLVFQAIEKQNETTSIDVIKDLKFSDRKTVHITQDQLKNLANIFDADYEDIFNDLLLNNISFDEITGEAAINLDKLKAHGIDLESVDEFATVVQDAVSDYFKQLSSSVESGLKGNLGREDFTRLQEFAADFMDLHAIATADGLRIANDEAIKLVEHMREVNSLQGEITFKALTDHLIETDERFESVSANAAYINQIQEERDALQREQLQFAKAQTEYQSASTAHIEQFDNLNGNTNLYNRPWIENANGTHSTISSISYTNEWVGEEEVHVMMTPIPEWAEVESDVLSEDELNAYFNALMEQNPIDVNALLELDAKGIEINGKKISNMIMDIKDASEVTEEAFEEEAIALHEWSDAWESIRRGKEAPDNSERISALEKEYQLAKEIYAIRSTREESAFNFMSNDIPGAQKNPINYYNNWAKAIHTFNDALKTPGTYMKEGKSYQSGFLDYQDWYNMITQMNSLADKSHEIEFAGEVLDGSMEAASRLIQKGAQSLVVTDTGEVKVALSGMALDFEAGADAFSSGVTDGIQNFAKSQVTMLDGVIQLLETIVAMEQLGDIEGEDHKLDFDDLFEWDFSGGKKTVKGFNEGYQQFVDYVIQHTDEKDRENYNEDLANGIKNTKIKVDGIEDAFTFEEMIGMSYSELAKHSEDGLGDAYAAVLAAWKQAALSGDYNKDNLYESIKQVLSATNFNGEIDIGDLHLTVHSGIVLERDKDNKFIIDGEPTDIKNADDALAATYAAEFKEALGSDREINTDGTVTYHGEIDTKVIYDKVNQTYTAIFSDGGTASSTTQDGLNAAIKAYYAAQQLNSSGEGGTEISGAPIEFNITRKGHAKINVQVDKSTGKVDANINDIIHSEEEAKDATKERTLFYKIVTEQNQPKEDLESNHVAAENGVVQDIQVGANSVADAIKSNKILAANNPAHQKVILDTPEGGSDAQGTIGLAKGNAFAKGTLMGELGPELVVSKGRYFVVGQNGPEMVNLADDAIVFNHLQTKSLLEKGMSRGRGKAVTNEYNAVAFATGNVNGGPAMASASAALAALKQLRDQWRTLAGLSVQDLAGKGGGGGGGGGGDPKAFLKDLEKWYDWLQHIAKLEQDINYEEALRNKISSEWIANGHAYYDSQKRTLEALKEQLTVQSDLTQSQEAYFEKRRKELNEQSAFSALYGFSESGQLYYKDVYADGKSAFEWLSDLAGRDETTGKANYTAEEQYNKLVEAGFGFAMEYDSSGNAIKKEGTDWYNTAVQAFWDKIDADKEEMQSLHDSVEDGYKTLEELQQSQNDLLKEMRDNQMDLEQKVYDAIVDTRERAIEELQDTKDAIKDSNDKFIKGLTDALQKEQNMYNNAESRKDLDKLRRQRDVLVRSGGSAAEIASLNDQIKDQEQSVYFEKQQEEIDAIQEASDKQIEKLEAQINLETEILEYQKKYGLLWSEVTDIMSKSPQEIADYIATNTQSYWDMSPVHSADELNKLRFSSEQWVSYRDDDSGLKQDIGSIARALTKTEESSNGGDSGSGSSAGDNNSGGGTSSNEQQQVDPWGWKSAKWVSDGASVGHHRHIVYNNGQEKDTEVQPHQWEKNGVSYKCSICNQSATHYTPISSTSKESDTKKQYASGGMNYETGEAILHGTKSQPEAVFNAEQTRILRNNILSNKPNSLINLLASYNDAYRGLSSGAYDSISNNSSNSTIIEKVDVNLNIDKLANDYDSRQAAHTIMDEMLRIASKTSANNSVRR